MKKTFVIVGIIVLAAFFVSCSSMRLTGKYAGMNHSFAETTLPYEEVWTRVIDYFALSGIPISTIDKSSGLIIASRISFLNHYTREVDGKPLSPDAYVVVPTVRGMLFTITPPTSIDGDWNIRIKEQDDRVIVNVNLVNLNAYIIQSAGTRVNIPVASLGNFENGLIDYLTKE